jgi:hypothetical protein
MRPFASLSGCIACALLTLVAPLTASYVAPAAFFARSHNFVPVRSGVSLAPCAHLVPPGTGLSYTPPEGLAVKEDRLVIPGSAFSYGNLPCDSSGSAVFSVSKFGKLPYNPDGTQLSPVSGMLLGGNQGEFIDKLEYAVASYNPEALAKMSRTSPTCFSSSGDISLLRILFVLPKEDSTSFLSV